MPVLAAGNVVLVRKIVRVPQAVLMTVGLFQCAAIGRLAVTLAVALARTVLADTRFHLPLSRLAGAPPVRLPSLAPLVVVAAHLALMLAALLAVGLVASGDRLLQRILCVLALAAGNVGAVIGLAVMVAAEPVAVLDRVVVPLVLAAVMVRLRIFMMVRRVVLVPLMGRLVVAFVVHLVMLGHPDMLGVGMVVGGVVSLVLHGGLLVMSFSVFVAGIGRVELLGDRYRNLRG